MEKLIQVIGLISAVLTTTAFLPQVIKTWKTRSTGDLSAPMFTLFFAGIAGWLIYGFLISDLPIILANLVTICLAGIILFFILRGNTASSLSHIGLYVRDLEKMKDYYCAEFNGKSSKKYSNPSKGFSSYFISFPLGSRIELMHSELSGNSAVEVNGKIHIAISVGSRKKVDEFAQKMQISGVNIISGPRMTGDNYYECVIRDPEGNLVEVTV